MPEEDNHWLLRMGSGAALLGAVLAGVGNLLHPITPRDDPPGVARVIADSDLWTPIHLLIVLGIILLLFGSSQLPKLARSMGQASKEFKKGVSEGSTDEDADSAT